jgi:2-keto-3-deoxy-L-rhamnonate aldolase RhmA
VSRSFLNRLRRGDQQFGTILTTPEPTLALPVALLGYDWLFLDGELGTFAPGNIAPVIAAIGDRAACFVRVKELEPEWIDAVFDAGAAGVIVPLVGTAHQAALAVELTAGRGMVVVQAETRDAVLNIDAIATVQGVDMVLIGPNDLSVSLGIPGELSHPAFREAVATIANACKRAAVPVGIYAANALTARPYFERGFTFIVVGVDKQLLAGAAKAQLTALRNAEPR